MEKFKIGDRAWYFHSEWDALNTMSKRLKGFVDDESIDQD